MRNKAPLISFTFDDFPQSALEIGGKILREHDIAGTYYVSLGLLGKEESVGRICSIFDLERALAQGHELGCHTFSHLDPWEAEPSVFENSIVQNSCLLKKIVPSAEFRTMSYPISTTPRPRTKLRAGSRFSCCRGGGQKANVETVDLNYVHGFFIERSRDTPSEIMRIIERNRTERGWLVFCTHDVSERPTRYGCTPSLLESVVRYSLESGTMVLPVSQALRLVVGNPNEDLGILTCEDASQ